MRENTPQSGSDLPVLATVLSLSSIVSDERTGTKKAKFDLIYPDQNITFGLEVSLKPDEDDTYEEDFNSIRYRAYRELRTMLAAFVRQCEIEGMPFQNKRYKSSQ